MLHSSNGGKKVTFFHCDLEARFTNLATGWGAHSAVVQPCIHQAEGKKQQGPIGDIWCSLQNVEPVLRACPELQKLNLASCRMLGENALDALLPAASGGPQMLNQIQVISSSVHSPEQFQFLLWPGPEGILLNM